MMGEVTLLIGGLDEDHVRLDLSAAIDEPGALDWAYHPARVAFRAGPFRGRFTTTIFAREITGFIRELGLLHSQLTGSATLALMEGTLRLVLTGDRRGGIDVAGEATDDPGTERRLRFGFRIDQTYLPPVLEAARALGPA